MNASSILGFWASIIRGACECLAIDADACWPLFDTLHASPLRRDVKISRATHLKYLEKGRHALYRRTAAFLRGDDQPMA
jgi:hypothetical protein